jgi:hypothetical protein
MHEDSRLMCEARRTRAVQPSGVGDVHECMQGEVGTRAHWRRNVRARQLEGGPDWRDPTVGEIERKVRWTSGSLLRKTGQAN